MNARIAGLGAMPQPIQYAPRTRTSLHAGHGPALGLSGDVHAQIRAAVAAIVRPHAAA